MKAQETSQEHIHVRERVIMVAISEAQVASREHIHVIECHAHVFETKSLQAMVVHGNCTERSQTAAKFDPNTQIASGAKVLVESQAGSGCGGRLTQHTKQTFCKTSRNIKKMLDTE